MESAVMQLQAPPKHSVSEDFMHKNRLQEYAQRSAIPLPLYQTINEGSQHGPKFRATVLVDGETYSSSQTFTTRKAAEQEVARLALEGIIRKIKDEGCPLIREDTVFCKSILNEYAVKMNLERPTYVTSKPEGLLPIFVSSLVFNGRRYNGGPGRNKREAEQLAARTVILSILGNSDSRTILSQIIKSKSKLYAALHYVNLPGVSHDKNVTHGGLEISTGNPLSSGNDVIMPTTGNTPSLSIVSHSTIVPSGQPVNAQVMPQAQPELKKPKEEILWDLNSGSTRDVSAVTNELSVSGLPINVASRHVDESQHVQHDGIKNALPLVGTSAVSSDSQATGDNTSIGGKRARKNKKKNKSKKARTDEH